jgi:hypothetical protein
MKVGRIFECGPDGADLQVCRHPARLLQPVVYRELGKDGFVITAFSTRRLRSFEKRKQVWP